MESEIYEELKKEFGEMNALYVAQIIAVQFTMKMKKSDLKTSGAYEARLKEKVRSKVLWRLTPNKFDEIWKIWSCIYDFNTSLSLPEGFGGHKRKTLREIYNSRN